MSDYVFPSPSNMNYTPPIVQPDDFLSNRPVKTEIEALKEELEKAKDYDDKLSKKETFIE
ncbi:hypothetical protein JHK87_047733 [Glycine soja]|nr:hypothetical protein JHK87_047733 [Glycine soja]